MHILIREEMKNCRENFKRNVRMLQKTFLNVHYKSNLQFSHNWFTNFQKHNLKKNLTS